MSLPRLERHLEKLFWGLLSAGLLALVGWVYTTGNRVTALETKVPTIDEKLDVIGQDVREIRKWVVPERR